MAKKQGIQWKKACFTWNNYPEDWVETLETNFRLFEWIGGEEVAPTTGTPHIQGYVEFDKKLRPTSLGLPEQISWRKANGSRAQNVTSCTKDGTNINGSLEYDEPLKVIKDLYDWQKDIVELCLTEANDRTIHWFYEEVGNKGKTALIKYLCFHHNALLVGGKASDAKYLITKWKENKGFYPKIVIFSFPRSIEDYVSYSAMEEIKDGMFCSTKYECEMVLMNCPHILCFANFYPDSAKLSEDRWEIKEL